MKKQLYLLFGLMGVGLHAQNMYVRTTTGVQNSYPITAIQKLTFSNGSLLLFNTSGKVDANFTLANLRYLNFNDLTLKNDISELTTSDIMLFPNPVTDMLNINFANQIQASRKIEIYSLEGRLLKEQADLPNEKNQINVSSLPIGIYFCKITIENKSQTIKFIKQ